MSTDAELLAQARERPEALGEFYDRYEPAVVAYFVRRVRDAEIALDLTAETFAEVVLQCHRGVEVREPLAWLFAIAQAKLANLHRRGAVDRRARARLGVGPVAVEDPPPEEVDDPCAEEVDDPPTEAVDDFVPELVDVATAEDVARIMEYDWHRDAAWDPFAAVYGLTS